MLRPYRSSEQHVYVKPFNVDRKKRVMFVFGLPLVMFVALIGLGSDLKSFMPSSSGGMRNLMVQCIHNLYAENSQMAIDTPKPPQVSAASEVPSGMAICQEWIRREAQNTFQPLYTQEDDSNCLDWTAPHYRVLEILASSILDRVNGLSRYRHDCYRSRVWDEAVTGMDRTTVQQLLPVARMTPNQDYFNTSEFKTQCKVCLDQFDPTIEKSRVKAASYHHCFTWPSSIETHNYTDEILTEPGGLYGEKIVIPYNISRPNVSPISSVWKQIRNRLGYVAKIFSNVTDSPPDEHNTGVVIYIDPTSTGIAKEIYPNYFPADVTSITVLASNLCATAYLPTGQQCVTYAESLVSHFRTLYPTLTNTGFGGLSGIRFQMTPSSAGSWSRMIRAKLLICPPTSPNCLIPAGSKLIDPLAGFNTSSFVLETVDSGKAIDFFNMVGHGDRATIERLLPADVPASVPKPDIPQQLTSTGEAVAEEFTAVNQDLDSEGYSSGSAPEPALSQSEAAATSDADVYAEAAASLPTNAENPNIYFPETEEVPSLEYINAKIAAGEPVNLNYSEQNTTKRATDEMVLDKDFGMTTRAYDSAVASEQTALRIASEKRIKLEGQAAKAEELAQAAAGESPPSLEMEVYCPSVTEDGDPIIIDQGTVEIHKNDKVMVSDGAGTAIFANDNAYQKETIAIPRDPDTSLPYTHIYDPVTKQNITITGTNITINTANGITKRDPVGILFVDNLTDPYSATLVTEGGTGNLRAGDTQKKYTGTIISTGQNRAEDGSVVRHGRGYAIKQRLEPGQKRTIYGWWNGFYSSQSFSSSESGGSGYEGSYQHHARPGLSSSDDPNNGGSSDSRDIGREMDNGVQPKDMVRKLDSDPIPDDMKRHLEKYGVGIKVSHREYQQFGEKRVCQNNREKVLAVQRAMKEAAAQQQEMRQQAASEPVAATERRVEEVVADAAPERRQLSV